MMLRIPTPVLFPAVLVLAAACGDQTVAWSPEQPVPAKNRDLQWGLSSRDRLGLPDMSRPPAQKPDAGTAWSGSVPPGWEELPADPGRFRHALWRVAGQPDTECYLTVATGGGFATNVSRWYGQFGQTMPDKAALAALPPIRLLGRDGHVLELAGTYTTGGKTREGFAAMIAFTVDGDSVTSVKFTGPQPVVAAQKDAFLALVPSIHVDAAPRPPADHGSAPANPTPAPAAYEIAVPAGWQPVTGSSRDLHYKLGAGSEFYLAGMGGDLRAMLDIWRSEMGQAPIDDAGIAALPKTTLLGQEAVVLDQAGDFTSMSGRKIEQARSLVVASKQGDSILFVKCVGPDAEVAPQRQAILDTIPTIRRKGP